MSFSFNKSASSLMVVDTAPVFVHTDSANGEFHWRTDDNVKVGSHPDTDYHQISPCKDWHDELRVPRPCVHLFNQPAPAQLFPATWAFQMPWYPTLYLMKHTPVIAAWQGLEITMMWDCRGPLEGCTNLPTNIAEQNKFTYELHPVIWDEGEDFAPGVLIGLEK